jgi:CubicO group peptidase (beta-lactamase class C family)
MSSLTQLLDDYLTEYEAKWPLSGTLLAARHGEVIFKSAYGFANIEHQVPHTIDSKFRIWSLTKAFTAMAVMQLVEQKLLKLNDPIAQYLPELNHFSGIQISHLLTHTSGLANYTSMSDYNNRLNRLKLTHQDVLDLFSDRPLAFQPGTSFSYNNTGYYLLGMIIARITGRTYENYVTDNLLQPLGMQNTGFDDNHKVVAKMSAAYHSNQESIIHSPILDMSSIYSAGAMYSTVDDLYKWDQALYTEKLVSKQTIGLIFQENVFNYGLGWFLDRRYDRRRIYHGGAYRGCRSELHRYPDAGVTIIMLTNYDFVPVFKLAESLTGIIFGESVHVPSHPQRYVLKDRTYAAYIGTYEGYGCKAMVDRDGDQLYFIWNDEAVIPFYPISESRFHHTWHDWECEFLVGDNREISFLGMKKI